MNKYIEVSRSDRILTLRLNRADKKNALDHAMYQSLADAISGADGDNGVRAIIITAAGDAYCSGNDLNDFLKSPPTDDSSPVIQFIKAIINVEKPIIAAVNGLAIGIGTTMLLHFDLVYASDNARFQLPFVNIGISPEAGSTYLLPALMGRQKAAELLLLGGMFDAHQALQLGIVNAVCAPDALQATAMEAATRIAAQPPNAVVTTKRLLKAAVKEQILNAYSRENEQFMSMLHGPEAKEALQAFMEKRKPDFSRF